MSSTDNTEIAKTDDSSLVSDSDKSLSDSISKKFSNVEIAYVKPDRIRVNVKKKILLMLRLLFVTSLILIMQSQ